MARATKAEVQRRIREVAGPLADCMTLRELRAIVNAKTSWGPTVSDSTLKYYSKRARAQMRAAAHFDPIEEFGISMFRYKRIIARAAASGDLRTELAASCQHDRLLNLKPPAEGEALDAAAARKQFILEIAEEMADHDNPDS